MIQKCPREGEKLRFGGGEKVLGEEYFQRQRVMGKICCLTGKQIFNHARHDGEGRFTPLCQPKAYLVVGVCKWGIYLVFVNQFT